MSETNGTGRKPSLAKGLVAGLIGGLAGAVAKTFAERMFPARAHDEAEPPVLLTRRELAPPTPAVVGEPIHWGFGAAAGAAYGALVEYFPAASAKEGASFGLALEGLTHNTLPSLESGDELEEMTGREQASGVTSHVVYGVATELVRGFVRRFL
jgi:putative membrane protein